MIHQPLGGFQGQATDIEIHAREILSMKQRLNEILAKHTGQAFDTVARDTERDNFKSAEAAQEYGLIDQVLARRPERSEEHTSELQTLMRISYAVFCLKN